MTKTVTCPHCGHRFTVEVSGQQTAKKESDSVNASFARTGLELPPVEQLRRLPQSTEKEPLTLK